MPPKRKTLIACFALILVALFVSGFIWQHKQSYPHGVTHRCNKSIHGCLYEYALAHEGNFPEGEDSAAALSKLVTEFGIGDWLWKTLAGKAFTDEQALQCVRDHGRLTEDFCSWHYVQGLRTDSNPGLVLFWDKTGLTHNGRRTDPPCYEVMFLSGSSAMIPASGWAAFMEKQERLREETAR